jgi:hypothetical protein
MTAGGYTELPPSHIAMGIVTYHERQGSKQARLQRDLPLRSKDRSLQPPRPTFFEAKVVVWLPLF